MSKSDGIAFTLDSRYAPFKLIGGGTSGFVAAAIDKEVQTSDGACSTVAIKKISRLSKDAFMSSRVLRELHVLQHFGRHSHPNVLGLRDLCVDTSKSFSDFDELYVITDYMETDLANALKLNPAMSEEHCRYLTYQLLRGIWALHTAEVIHRDIKPQNILINSNCDLKLADFGLARSIYQNPSYAREPFTEYVVTRWYRAPEVLLESRSYGKPVDVWAAGCVLAEMFLGKVFFKGSNNIDQLTTIFNIMGTPDQETIDQINNPSACKYIRSLKPVQPQNFRSLFPTSVSDEAIDLLSHMLEMNPAKRYTADQCLQHPFFQEYFLAEDLAINVPVLDMSYEQKYLRPQPRRSGAVHAVPDDDLTRAAIKRLIIEEFRKFKKIHIPKHLSSPISGQGCAPTVSQD